MMLSVAILGAGNIAGGFDEKRHDGDDGIYTHAGAYLEHGAFKLTTVFDSDIGRAEYFADYWRVEKIASRLEDILTTHHDVISLCTPDQAHYQCLVALIQARCCKAIFVEKPLALRTEEVADIVALAERHEIKVLVNFQRRFEPVHAELRRRIATSPHSLLSANGYYMKGLRHIGVTMIDCLNFLCGMPNAVLAFNRVYNEAVSEFSYEFVLYYAQCAVTVRTIDSASLPYAYHLFELDLLFADGRSRLVDISQGVLESGVTAYAYAGVNVLNEKQAAYRETNYRRSMVAAVAYLHDITQGSIEHTVNTPLSSYNNALVADRIVESYEAGLKKLNF